MYLNFLYISKVLSKKAWTFSIKRKFLSKNFITLRTKINNAINNQNELEWKYSSEYTIIAFLKIHLQLYLLNTGSALFIEHWFSPWPSIRVFNRTKNLRLSMTFNQHICLHCFFPLFRGFLKCNQSFPRFTLAGYLSSDF